jgi:hypothetical protein
MRCSGSNSLALPRELALDLRFFRHRLATGEPRTALRARGAIGRIIAPDDPFRSALQLPTCCVTDDTEQLIDIMTCHL